MSKLPPRQQGKGSTKGKVPTAGKAIKASGSEYAVSKGKGSSAGKAISSGQLVVAKTASGKFVTVVARRPLPAEVFLPRMPAEVRRPAPSAPFTPREYAGRWVAWSPDGGRIVASGSTLRECEGAAAKAGYADDQVAFERVPTSRQRETGSGA